MTRSVKPIDYGELAETAQLNPREQILMASILFAASDTAIKQGVPIARDDDRYRTFRAAVLRYILDSRENQNVTAS